MSGRLSFSYCLDLVGQRVAIHLQHVLEHVVAVAVVDRDVVDFVELRDEVVVEGFGFLGGVVLGKVVVVKEHVVRDVVGLENLVVSMNGVVDDGADALHSEQPVQVGRYSVELLVDAWCE